MDASLKSRIQWIPDTVPAISRDLGPVVEIASCLAPNDPVIENSSN
jgi:hypothetical protein